MKPSILIAEDKLLLAEDLIDRLESFGYTSIIGPFSTAEEAMNRALKETPSLAILDINLKGAATGIQLARELNELQRIPVIYLTQLDDEQTLRHSIEPYAIAFLSKPFTNAELKHALMKAEKMLEDAPEVDLASDHIETLDDRIFIRNGRGKVQIMIDDILWIQSGGGETSAITVAQRHKEGKLPYTVGFNLNKLEERLSFSKSLIRCSRFHIVNIEKVHRILSDANKSKNKRILEIENTQIAVGDKYRKPIIDRFHIV